MRKRVHENKRLSMIKFNDDNGTSRTYSLGPNGRLPRIGNRRSPFQSTTIQPISNPVAPNSIPDYVSIFDHPGPEKSEESMFFTEFCEGLGFENQFERF
jgi:hypothetical protein